MEDRCVCCGAVVPEGRMVCGLCELREDNGGIKIKTNEVKTNE